MAKRTYREKLMDPRWQRKRLEILNRDKFRCQACGDDKKTLHVHHLRYGHGMDPWEYSDKDLQTLCAPCHEFETFEREKAEYLLRCVLRSRGWTAEHILQVCFALDDLSKVRVPPLVIALSLEALAKSPAAALAKFWAEQAGPYLKSSGYGWLYDAASNLLEESTDRTCGSHEAEHA